MSGAAVSSGGKVATDSVVVSDGAVDDSVVGGAVVTSEVISAVVASPVVPTKSVVVVIAEFGLVVGAAVVLFLSVLLELLPQDEFFLVTGSAGTSP